MTRYVGDIHGQVDKLKEALNYPGKVVFVGDFVDSFRTTVAEQVECIELVLQAIEHGMAQAVFGNHEMSYFGGQCSGWNPAMQAHFDGGLGEKIRKAFKPYIWEDDILVTHAGVTKQLWDQHNMSKETMCQTLSEWYNTWDSPYYQVGQYRGGRHPYGGPLWCDWSEFVDVPGLTQIVGHSRGKTFRIKGDSICIDVLENIPGCEFLEIDPNS
jgi:hypothetical protein